jgi:hypothetical protein
LEVEIGRIVVLGHPGQKVSKTLSQQVRWVWWHVHVISTFREA